MDEFAGEGKTDPFRVLVAEDDVNLAERVIEYLKISGPFLIDYTPDVSGVWENLGQNEYDIILLDYKPPDSTGLDVLKEIDRRAYNVPVIMITGVGDERLAVQAIRSGAVDYLVKGTDYLSTLPTQIEKAIRSHRLHKSVQSSLDQVRYHALLLNNVRDAVVVWDTEGKINYWNPAAEALFQCSGHELLGQPVDISYLDKFSPSARIPSKEATGGQEIERQYTRNGSSIWVSSRVTALRDFGADGRLIGYMDVSRDITGRKKAEEALRAERNFVSGVLNTVGALIIILDRQGRIVQLNRASEQTSGYTSEELKGKLVWESSILPEETQRVKRDYAQLLAGHFPIESEHHWVTKSGSQRLISWSNTAILDRQDQVEYIIATGIDITERIQAEQALRESEARYRTVSELVSDYVYALNIGPEDNVTCEWMTDAFVQISGFDNRKNGRWENWINIVHPEDREVACELARNLLSNQVVVCEFRILTKDQQVRWLRNYARPVWNESKRRVTNIYGAAKDITERKLMETQIQNAQTHLAQSTRLAAIGELASGVAHHINNPLTTIIAESQILLQDLPVNHSGRESAEAIEQAGRRVQKAVQQLLDFSQPTSDTIEKVSIKQTVKNALDLVRDHICSSGIHLKVDLAQGLPAVPGNSRQLCDLWVNLLLLSSRASADGQTQTVGVKTGAGPDGSILVQVNDDGEIIPAAEMATLFEPNFIKAIGNRGTGIELSICQHIVSEHKGHVAAESKPEQGTTFHVYLPMEGAHDIREYSRN